MRFSPYVSLSQTEILFLLLIIIEDRYLYLSHKGWSGGAKVLGKLSVPGRPTNLDNSRARAYCACSGWGCLDIFFSPLSFLFSFSLSGRRPDID